MGSKYDFSGWATKFNIKCSDGRTIRDGAFKDQDGQTVPLVYQHCHDSVSNVLGHALLKYVPGEGMYTYGSFNDTEDGQKAKKQVAHGDIRSLSIYANQLQQVNKDVMHGAIREVSLVLAGANIGAVIDNPVLAHGDGEYEDVLTEAVIYSGLEQDLTHADAPDDKQADENGEGAKPKDDEDERTVKDIYESFSEAQKNAIDLVIAKKKNPDMKVDEGEIENSQKAFNSMSDAELKAAAYIIGSVLEKEEDEVKHSDDDGEEADETVKDVFDTLTEKQKKVVYFMLSQVAEEYSKKNGGEETMKHNVFDKETDTQANVLSHDDFKTILADAKRCGSLKDAVLAHMEDGVLSHAVPTDGMETPTGTNTYGFRDPSMVFPDAHAVSATPEWIKRDTDWVSKVVGAAHKTPFSRIKSVFANITEDDARAKGYMKGKLKKEEVFSLLKRATSPQTIYKKQKLDRDDILDITDFDVVAWIKSEMNIMLDEEKARAILICDGRLNSSDDKISEDHIRPIVNDKPLFTIKADVEAGATDELTAKNVIKACLKSRKDYKGSGTPTLFTTEEWLTNMLLIEDDIGHRLYKTDAEVATACRVKEIVTVPVMEGFKDADNKLVYGIIVNMADYTIGADKGGQTALFEDFDIDYNQEKYLIETRMSGALTKPFSAIVLRAATASANVGG
jgi:hypothetical protein